MSNIVVKSDTDGKVFGVLSGYEKLISKTDKKEMLLDHKLITMVQNFQAITKDDTDSMQVDDTETEINKYLKNVYNVETDVMLLKIVRIDPKRKFVVIYNHADESEHIRYIDQMDIFDLTGIK